MAYVRLFPKSAQAERQLADDATSVMNLLQQATRDVLEVPDHDIIVELNRCTAIAFNQSALNAGAIPDVVIQIATSDHQLKPRFQALCDQIVSRWDAQPGQTLKIELWVNLIDTWGCNIDFT